MYQSTLTFRGIFWLSSNPLFSCSPRRCHRPGDISLLLRLTVDAELLVLLGPTHEPRGCLQLPDVGAGRRTREAAARGAAEVGAFDVRELASDKVKLRVLHAFLPQMLLFFLRLLLFRKVVLVLSSTISRVFRTCLVETSALHEGK